MRGTKPQLVVDNDAVTDAPPAPQWMADSARDEWKRVMPSLVKRRILTTADLGSVENYCIVMGRVRQAERAIRAADDVEDKLKLIRVQDKAMATARQLAAELGLTPVSRSRPSIRDDGDDDSLLDQ